MVRFRQLTPRQPVLIATRDESPNAATMLVLVDGASSARLAAFKRVCDMFDGNDEAAVEAARARWRQASEGGHELAYWQQTEAGWQKRGAG